jgi:hypothetical protein
LRPERVGQWEDDGYEGEGFEGTWQHALSLPLWFFPGECTLTWGMKGRKEVRLCVVLYHDIIE